MKLPRALRDIRTIKTLLTNAETEATNGGDDLPGPEHLLLSTIGLPDGTARRAFQRLGIEPDHLRTAINDVHQEALARIGVTAHGHLEPATPNAPTGPHRMTAPAQQAFHSAVALSKTTRPALLRGGHIVIAVCEQEHGTVTRAIKALGIDRAALTAAAHEELAAG
ncbi:Clp protease N-terminal domain-containing protein [Micromonospora sp. CPCC 206060]|uniref:Clp protease N-terminal domain-containing protein n=1 Tax=Micromonospora sp. CPCC 206060 TaxID=3122406 RepID=UPI002FF3D363